LSYQLGIVRHFTAAMVLGALDLTPNYEIADLVVTVVNRELAPTLGVRNAEVVNLDQAASIVDKGENGFFAGHSSAPSLLVAAIAQGVCRRAAMIWRVFRPHWRARRGRSSSSPNFMAATRRPASLVDVGWYVGS
jgi:hypothetical protein